jgi:hypothetical protein
VRDLVAQSEAAPLDCVLGIHANAICPVRKREAHSSFAFLHVGHFAARRAGCGEVNVERDRNSGRICLSDNSRAFKTEPDDIFFGIVQRGAAMIILKAIGVDPVPNYTPDIKQGIARWDAYVDVPDPDVLAAEFSSRNVEFFVPLKDTHDGLRGFELQDVDGYVLFFGRTRS